MTRYSSFIKYLFPLIILIPHPLYASDNQTDIKRLITSGSWSQAAKQILLQARDIYPRENSIAVNLAKSGYFKDAQDSLEKSYPSTYNIISVLRSTSKIPEQDRLKLIEQAAQYATGPDNGTNPNNKYVLSTNLARISLYYSSLDLEEESRALFYEALTAAKDGLSGSGRGYQGVTSLMVQADINDIKSWMIPPVIEHLSTPHHPEYNAHACMDMMNLGEKKFDAATSTFFMGCTHDSINRISQKPTKQRLLSELANTKALLGMTGARIKKTPLVMALGYSRSGLLDKANAEIAKAGMNLYVDLQREIYKKVILDAIDREDLNAAVYFAERPPSGETLHSQSLVIWQRIAEAQWRKGIVESAHFSYEQGLTTLNSLNSNPPRILSPYLVKKMGDFGKSLLQQGMAMESQHALQIIQNIHKNSPYASLDDHAEAAVYLAELMLTFGLKDKGEAFILEAYDALNSMPLMPYYDGLVKARLLSSLALVLSEYAGIVNPSNRMN